MGVAMDGVLTRVVGQVDVGMQPRPFVTPERMAARYRPAEDAEPSRPKPMQRDVLVRLFADGVLHHRQVAAGQEISRVYAVITAAVGARVIATYGERLPGGTGEDFPPSLRAAYVDRYKPWREWAGAIAATPARSLADLTLLICVDGLTPRQLRPVVGLHEQTIKRRLQVSLHQYCRIAGWLVNDRA